MSEPVKQVILRDPKTNEILIPKIVGTLGYEPAEDGTLIPPYSNDADTLGGKTADQFAAANHDHSGVYATPEQLNEVKTSVAEGKALVAAAVSDKGVETAADATFATIASAIEQINTGIEVNGVEAIYQIESGETVNAGDFIRIVKKSGWITGSNSVTAPSVSAIHLHNIIKLTNTRAVILYYEDDTTTTDVPLYLAVVDIAADGTLTLTSGKAVSSAKYAAYGGGICRLSDTSVFITHSANSSSAYTYGLVVTIASNGTITAGSDTQLSTTACDRARPIALSSTKVLVLWVGVYNATSYGMICTVSTRTISKGSQIDYTTLTSSNPRDIVLCNNMVLVTTMNSQSLLINSSGSMVSLNPIPAELFQYYGKNTAVVIGSKIYFIHPTSTTQFKYGIVSMDTSTPNVVTTNTINSPVNLFVSTAQYEKVKGFICTDGIDTIVSIQPGTDNIMYAFVFKVVEDTIELVSHVATSITSSQLTFMDNNDDVYYNLNNYGIGFALLLPTGNNISIGKISQENDTVKSTTTNTLHGIAKTGGSSGEEITIFIPS